ncbi:DUF1510 family protein [Geomicrobium sp. JCM 19039]|uniref:DUF1510 family protein n=1 Tax=Geomicrobium sp. JCM 19039 TaxID=1460636 RepID=UPI00045F2684|nr:DUF1510 family protein [Geomicrobium sp. JCM 19039]GAK11347.1 hypothetical protein JCM19039_1036 [Geomicrobium sp. JCM 19039]
MDENQQYQRESRAHMRKKRTINRMLNVSIGVVVLLIGFFMFTLLFSESEEVADDEVDEEVDNESDVEEDEDPLDITEPENDEEDITEPIEEDAIEEDDEDNDSEESDSSLTPPEDGDFQPIGTEQESLDFTFTDGTQNRAEMMQAMEYATGIPEEDWDYLERIENNGGHGLARGTMYYEGSPYRVEMEWLKTKVGSSQM